VQEYERQATALKTLLDASSAPPLYLEGLIADGEYDPERDRSGGCNPDGCASMPRWRGREMVVSVREAWAGGHPARAAQMLA
jgi:hypothetical protein